MRYGTDCSRRKEAENQRLSVPMLLAKYFANLPRSPISPHPQPLSQPWERGADYGRIRVSRIRQQRPSLTHHLVKRQK
ncbi:MULTISPECIES: hypothetical protein [unclassified Moorena]|uniref:hypothetical protein n=1 Tax=unclassified Moorena TaxID=2683338 RepID=UPI0013B85448|nr:MULTISPECIES: hypothetical protein [unclassified Moorena]NER92071.1 hypothetical protein [Moorena sp. SIO3A2]